jgi:hypothetical protein
VQDAFLGSDITDDVYGRGVRRGKVVALGVKGPDTTSLSQEQTAVSDREMACRLGGVADPSSIPPWPVLSEEMDEELLAKLSALYMGASAEEFDTGPATRHNCDHESWQYVRGEHRCEECYHTLPSYIFECRQCHIQACNRCRKNGL